MSTARVVLFSSTSTRQFHCLRSILPTAARFARCRPRSVSTGCLEKLTFGVRGRRSGEIHDLCTKRKFALRQKKSDIYPCRLFFLASQTHKLQIIQLRPSYSELYRAYNRNFSFYTASTFTWPCIECHLDSETQEFRLVRH